MDFVHDELSDGRKIRPLTITDLFTRKWLAIEVGFSLRADDVVAAKSPATTDRSSPAGGWTCGLTPKSRPHRSLEGLTPREFAAKAVA